MSTQKITNLATPTASADAATKGYVDAAAGGSEYAVFYQNRYASRTNYLNGRVDCNSSLSCPTGYSVFFNSPSCYSLTGNYTVYGSGSTFQGSHILTSLGILGGTTCDSGRTNDSVNTSITAYGYGGSILLDHRTVSNCGGLSYRVCCAASHILVCKKD